jgi:hypothetical protein
MLLGAAACGTDAVGVSDCRTIEQARCSAGVNCGLVTDVGECQRFYRDQCLHGLAVGAPPTASVQACANTILAAGQCAAQGAATLLDACTNAPTSSAPTLSRACEIVSTPEKTAECAFLAPTADAGTDAAGSGGTAGGGGTAGSGGTAGVTSDAG